MADYVQYAVEHTKFIYHSNFAGDPNKSFGSKTRSANLMINNMDIVKDMKTHGINVKSKVADTQYGEMPLDIEGNCYYVKVVLSFSGKSNPNVVLATQDMDGMHFTQLNADTAKLIDDVRVQDVRCVFHPGWDELHKCWVLYINELWVMGSQNMSQADMGSYYASVVDTF